MNGRTRRVGAASARRPWRAMELLDERFPGAAGGSPMAVFAVDHGGTLDSRREVIEAALARVAKVEHVATVTDPFEAGTVSPDGCIGFAELTFDLPASDLGPAPFEALAGAIAPAPAAGVTAELGGDAVFVNADAETSGTEAVVSWPRWSCWSSRSAPSWPPWSRRVRHEER